MNWGFRFFSACALAGMLTAIFSSAHAQENVAETRLLEIYQLIARGESAVALRKATLLVRDFPNFQLAQLTLGDLYASRSRRLHALGDTVPNDAVAGLVLKELRDQARLRAAAQARGPTPGTVPVQFAALAPGVHHAIAVDASLSRLYLLENSSSGLRTVANYYISLGKLGLEKAAEGDRRTPLGIYFIRSHLPKGMLKDQYGIGALPISYPNPYDQRKGKGGSGIWLHGTPSQQYARAPWATDGCVVLTNDDMRLLISSAQIGATPVVIAPSLRWVPRQEARSAASNFEKELDAWKQAKSSGDLKKILGFYAKNFESAGRTPEQWRDALARDSAAAAGRPIDLKDLSILSWNDSDAVMVVTFGQVVRGERKGVTKRQYWIRENRQWKIFFEGDPA